MFDWYRNAQVCYAYLSDVSSASSSHHDLNSSFRNSKWFTRGWTLQELLAPHWIQFFDEEWTEIGTKSSLRELITSITGIEHLFNFNDASVAQKMCWASNRETTRLEDQAYCLMGLFGVKMPPLYGEGRHAFMRLQSEIINKTDDETIFAWMRPESFGSTGLIDETGMLAPSPAYFERSGRVRTYTFDYDRPPHTMTNKGLRLELLTFEASKGVEVVAPLNAVDGDEDNILALRLWKSHTSYSRSAELYHIEKLQLSGVMFKGRGVFFVGQSDDNPQSPFPQKVVFNTQSLKARGFEIAERQVYPIIGCAYWQFEHGDRRGPTLHRFKPYWQRAAIVLEKNNSARLIIILGISRENHLWVDIIAQDISTENYIPTTFPEDGNTDRVSRPVADGYSVTAVLKKDHSLGLEGYVLDITLDPKGALPWPPTQIWRNESDMSMPVMGLDSKRFTPDQLYTSEKSPPTPVSRVFSAMSLGSSKGKMDRKTSFGFPKK
jgi:hypothetical protein